MEGDDPCFYLAFYLDWSFQLVCGFYSKYAVKLLVGFEQEKDIHFKGLSLQSL